MKTILQIERPYVHGLVQITRNGDRIHVVSNRLTVNGVPVIIEGVIVRGQLDQWRVESFKGQRAEPHVISVKLRRNWGESKSWKTSRRNQERAREEVLQAVALWAGGRPQPKPATVYSSDDEGGLAELLGSIGV
jgi:hypothetical protein